MAVLLPIVLTVLIVMVYLPALALLFIYSANLYYMTALALINRRRRPHYAQIETTLLPSVTVQLPLYNERFVGQLTTMRWHG
ncbi:MAG: hypothetical protein U0528_16190 [Anaerolineae bacterium]